MYSNALLKLKSKQTANKKSATDNMFLSTIFSDFEYKMITYIADYQKKTCKSNCKPSLYRQIWI